MITNGELSIDKVNFVKEIEHNLLVCLDFMIRITICVSQKMSALFLNLVL
jgi:hypothetical protein